MPNNKSRRNATPKRQPQEKSRVPKPTPKSKSLLSRVGDAVQLASTAAGMPAAGSAFKAFTNIFGSGAYRTGGGRVLPEGQSPPMFKSAGAATRICHREYVSDVVGSVAFANTVFAVNPGNPDLFPWLAGIAAQYGEYCFNGVVFEFKSTSANALNSTNTALGTVITAADYNPVNGPFTTKLQMENYEYATSSKPSESVMYMMECANSLTPIKKLYVNAGTQVPAGADPRLYDFASFQIATVGMQAAATIGELWVTYDVTLYKANLEYAITPAASTYSMAINMAAVGTSTDTGFFGPLVGALTNSNTTAAGFTDAQSTFGNTVVPGIYLGVSAGSTVGSSGQLRFGTGCVGRCYAIIGNVYTGASTQTAAASFVAANGAVLVPNTAYFSTFTSQTVNYACTVYIGTANASLSLAWGGSIPTNAVKVSVLVTQIDQTFYGYPYLGRTNPGSVAARDPGHALYQRLEDLTARFDQLANKSIIVADQP